MPDGFARAARFLRRGSGASARMNLRPERLRRPQAMRLRWARPALAPLSPHAEAFVLPGTASAGRPLATVPAPGSLRTAQPPYPLASLHPSHGRANLRKSSPGCRCALRPCGDRLCVLPVRSPVTSRPSRSRATLVGEVRPQANTANHCTTTRTCPGWTGRHVKANLRCKASQHWSTVSGGYFPCRNLVRD